MLARLGVVNVYHEVQNNLILTLPFLFPPLLSPIPSLSFLPHPFFPPPSPLLSLPKATQEPFTPKNCGQHPSKRFCKWKELISGYIINASEGRVTACTTSADICLLLCNSFWSLFLETTLSPFFTFAICLTTWCSGQDCGTFLLLQMF